jgi:type IV pilus assembly protein PilW
MTRGFSIVELLVGVTISLLLLMGVVALFMSSRQSYEMTERLSRIQENGRFALDQIVNDVRASGYMGCARPTPNSSRARDFAISSLNSSTSLLWNFGVPIQGYQSQGGGAWAPTLDTVISGLSPNQMSDVLVLRIPRPDAVALRVLTRQSNPADALAVSTVSPAPVEVGDTVMISDCLARAFFQVTQYSGGVLGHAQVAGAPVTSGSRTRDTPGNQNASLLHPFERGADIVPVSTVIYYLAPSTADATRTSLWRKTGGDATEELAEGIERFELQYGVDTTGDGRVDSYGPATAATNWANVYSLRIALLARSPDSYGTDRDPETYTLLDASAGPFNDRNQRQVLTSTVALRNQIID